MGALILAACLFILNQRQTPNHSTEPAIPVQKSTALPEVKKPSASVTPAPSPNYGKAVKLRPLPIVQESATHQWTEGNGSAVEVVTQIAHNDDEVIRMMEENERIKRRQLVYRQDTAAAVVQRARAAGESVRRLTLPGLDGQEIEVEVIRADLALSGLSGSFTGRIAGKQQSMVTLAFKLGREAFSIASPEDRLYLEAEPREPGEVIVKTIDPSTYATGHCGTPEYQANQGK